jgi:peptidoglycan hydrolase-like protein with peptidoglycan-binding domain
MTRIRPFLTAAAALTTGMALTPILVSATPASAAEIPPCTGTSLVRATSDHGAVRVRVPTFGNRSGDWECNLEFGDDGVPVARLQIALDSRCNFSAGIPVDNDYGTRTRNAVRRLQAGIGVHVDGEYGPATAQAMFWPVAGSNGTACGNNLGT